MCVHCMLLRMLHTRLACVGHCMCETLHACVLYWCGGCWHFISLALMCVCTCVDAWVFACASPRVCVQPRLTATPSKSNAWVPSVSALMHCPHVHVQALLDDVAEALMATSTPVVSEGEEENDTQGAAGKAGAADGGPHGVRAAGMQTSDDGRGLMSPKARRTILR